MFDSMGSILEALSPEQQIACSTQNNILLTACLKWKNSYSHTSISIPSASRPSFKEDKNSNYIH